ncbi:MAG: hypothetical protein A2252_00840 [Elusimicrobia bacterium RIFOXYA2_FULL_39_19]|nr:MAG: hypothetical protein A2252_00840 [Elusimicrobia bacterium RIFOXYA2_FULL_39_19]
MNKFHIGLALGGGGARSLAHLGVIKALEQNRVKPDIVTGTSMGAFIGGLYALHNNAQNLNDKMEWVLKSDALKKLTTMFFNHHDSYSEKHSIVKKVLSMLKRRYIYTSSLIKPYLIENSIISELLEQVFGNTKIEEAKIPFAAVALDLVSGREVVFKKGLFKDALLASMAMPAVFSPVKTSDGGLLVDGAVINAVPVNTAFGLGADFVIASVVSTELRRKENFGSGLDVIIRTGAIAENYLNNIKSSSADAAICPGVGKFHWSNFKKAQYFMDQGEKTTLEAVHEIQSAITKKKVRHMLGLNTRPEYKINNV